MHTDPNDDLRRRLGRLEAENRRLAARLRLVASAGAGLLGLALFAFAPRPGEARPQDPRGLAGLMPEPRTSFARIGNTLVNFNHVTRVRMEDAGAPAAGLTVYYLGGDQQDRFEGEAAEFVLRWMVGTGSAPPLERLGDGPGAPRPNGPAGDPAREGIVPPPRVDPDGP